MSLTVRLPCVPYAGGGGDLRESTMGAGLPLLETGDVGCLIGRIGMDALDGSEEE